MSKRKYLSLIILATLLTCLPVNSTELKKITLDEAIQLSLGNNLDIQSARIDVELAKNTVKIADKFKNPDLNLFLNYGQAGKAEPQMVGVSELLEIGKKLPRKQLAKANLVQKELTVKSAEFTLEMDVRETYADLVAAKTILASLLEQEKLLRELYAIASKRHIQKKSSISESLQVQMVLNNLTVNINNAQTALNHARNEFNKTLNLKDNFIAYDSLEEYLPDETVFISLKTPDYNKDIPSFSEIEQMVISKRYDIQIAKQDVSVAEKKLKVATKEIIPDLEVVGGYSFLPKSYTESGVYKSGAYVGANIKNIPLFNTGRQDVENAKLSLKQAQINYESLNNKARKDLNNAYDKLITSQKNLRFYKNQLVKDSEYLLKEAKRDYVEGNADLTSVIVMAQSYREIYNGYVTALADYYTDWIDFLREVCVEDYSWDKAL